MVKETGDVWWAMNDRRTSLWYVYSIDFTVSYF